jgi:hypothetical protein
MDSRGLTNRCSQPWPFRCLDSQHIYEVRPRKDKRGFDLISDALPFGRFGYTEIPHAIGYATFYSRSHHAVIRVYDDAGNVIKMHEHAGDFKEPKRIPITALPP